MMLRPLLLSAALGLAALGGSLHSSDAQAQVRVGIGVNLAPPPPRYERVVVRPGYVWAPGYWQMRGRRHVWVAGSLPAGASRVCLSPRAVVSTGAGVAPACRDLGASLALAIVGAASAASV